MFSHNNGGLCGEFGVVQLFGPIVNMVRAVFAFSVLNWEHLTPLVVVRVFQTFVSMDAAREEISFLFFFLFLKAIKDRVVGQARRNTRGLHQSLIII